jgi:hypothetical protein
MCSTVKGGLNNSAQRVRVMYKMEDLADLYDSEM